MRKLHQALQRLVLRLHRPETGASMVEYGLLIGLLAIACAAILSTLGTDLSAFFGIVDTDVKTAAGS
jgi:pilus assembly protein Flp/PilA